MSSPIADLTYRNYDGPIEPPIYRWWGIAKMMMRLSIKKKGFWVWSSFSAYFYLILGAIFYFAEALSPTVSAQAGQGVPIPSIFRNIIWKDQFLTAFNTGQIFFLIITLLIGAGAIAGDNKANALLVYLSKPLSKRDYIIGKWFGVFIPLAIVTAAPMLLFFAYCLLSYRQYGVVSQDPWLVVKLLLLAPVPAAFHASVILGVSSLFNQGRLAGAAYAGVYFLTNFLTIAASAIRLHGPGQSESPLLTTLYYCSVDGIQQAMAKIILGTRGSTPFGPQNSDMLPDIPSKPLFIGLYFGICAAFVLLAWRKVRAVEVIG